MSILVTDTTLRDAHQSLIATRMRTRDMLPIAEQLDKVGFFSIEMWGGATFDACIRFLNEDPWERLRGLRSKIKNTRLQMLLRGQNLVGYRHYGDDVLREFVRLSVKNGIDVFRVFDALNDLRNMETAIRAVKDQKAHVQGTIAYTISPVHSIAGFAEMAAQLEALGCDSICVKDMAGLISPSDSYDLVRAIKHKVRIPLNLHSHCSSGIAPMSYQAAASAGVDMLDTAFSAFAWGTSQPPTESIVAAFKGTPFDTGLDLELLYEIGEYFATVATKYRRMFTAETTRPNVNALIHQIPGGMLSNLVSQLRDQNALDRIGEVLEEIPRVRKDFGYPPLVTPTSQIVGTQAVLNVLSGARYRQVTQEVKAYLLGKYGRPPGTVDEETRRTVVGDETPILDRPGETIGPELEKLRDDAHRLGIIRQEEDLLTYALYPQVAVRFLRGETKEEAIPEAQSAGAPATVPDLPVEFAVDVDGEVFNVKVGAVIGRTLDVGRSYKGKEEGAEKGNVISPMQGMILYLKVKIGEEVKEGDVVATIEAMKMQTEVRSPHGGVVRQVLVHEGEIVNSGEPIMVVIP
jgi:pyruvate carboxylase subunit B